VRNLGHFALWVDDVDDWHHRLDEQAIEHVVATYTPGAGHQIFLHDPAGNQIELNQPDH
jgi:catechol 2,3-dioxygenase-like lactoylglutathione lyase family enzyme